MQESRLTQEELTGPGAGVYSFSFGHAKFRMSIRSPHDIYPHSWTDRGGEPGDISAEWKIHIWELTVYGYSINTGD